MTALNAWLAKAPRDRVQLRLLAANGADALGTGLFLPLSVIYLTRIIGLSPGTDRARPGHRSFVAIVAPTLSGTMLGRLDARMVVVGCFAACACGFAAYTAVGSFASFVCVATLVQFAGAARDGRAHLGLPRAPAGRLFCIWSQCGKRHHVAGGRGGAYSSASRWAAGRRRRAWAGSTAAAVVTSSPPTTAAAAMR
jgi:hypothetical protein